MRKSLPKITEEENEMLEQMPLKPTGESIPVDCEVRRKVLDILREWGKSDSRCDGYWYGYSRLQQITKLSYVKLQLTLKQLEKEGLVERRETYSDDGKLNGSGWFISA